ncbi:acyltransferase family protein [Cellvibrio mixtus]|uniref:acyltransferase family protein n=1 Tax=Cellvibrio mixtus TaxID=39650 RepID=UPI00058666C9|nr:heparan-alpha-glucosaminide N-acetyltransferase domain-containing protein [Cellvibrio mixtus]
MVKQRFLALDVMRGLTLALMILVNTPGSWEFVYGPLLHADWHGATPTDFVFPFFMFIVGSAMYFAVRGLSQLNAAAQTKKIARRVALLFLIGVLLAAYPFNESLDQWRIMGVLQRIAIAYGFAAFIILYFGFTARVVISAILLVGYWGLLNLVADPYSLEHSIVRQVDLSVLGASHLWQGKGMPFDPEGILSTFPSIVNVLIGFEATRVLLTSENKEKALSKLFVSALLLIALALAWSTVFPINKSLWTSPFVLLTCGVAILVLLLLVKIEQSAAINIARPVYHFFEIIGKNPLFIYVLSGLLATTLYLIPVGSENAYSALYGLFRNFADPYFASFLFAILMVAILWFVAWVLHKRNIIISL